MRENRVDGRPLRSSRSSIGASLSRRRCRNAQSSLQIYLDRGPKTRATGKGKGKGDCKGRVGTWEEGNFVQVWGVLGKVWGPGQRPGRGVSRGALKVGAILAGSPTMTVRGSDRDSKFFGVISFRSASMLNVLTAFPLSSMFHDNCDLVFRLLSSPSICRPCGLYLCPKSTSSQFVLL